MKNSMKSSLKSNGTNKTMQGPMGQSFGHSMQSGTTFGGNSQSYKDKFSHEPSYDIHHPSTGMGYNHGSLNTGKRRKLKRWRWSFVLISVLSAVVGALLFAMAFAVKTDLALAKADSEAVTVKGICSSKLEYKNGTGCATMYEVAEVQTDDAIKAALGSFANIFLLHCFAGVVNLILAIFALKWAYISPKKAGRSFGAASKTAFVYFNLGLLSACCLIDFVLGGAAINKFNDLSTLASVSSSRASMGGGFWAMTFALTIGVLNAACVYFSAGFRRVGKLRSQKKAHKKVMHAYAQGHRH